MSNPVDAMAYIVFKETGFPKNRVIGQSGVLDTARFCAFVAEELNVSVKDVKGVVLGAMEIQWCRSPATLTQAASRSNH